MRHERDGGRIGSFVLRLTESTETGNRLQRTNRQRRSFVLRLTESTETGCTASPQCASLSSFVLRLTESTETIPFARVFSFLLGSFVLRLTESTETFIRCKLPPPIQPVHSSFGSQRALKQVVASGLKRAFVVHSSFGSQRALKPNPSDNPPKKPRFIRPSAHREH